MAHIWPTELDTHSYLVTFSQKLLNFARLYVYIMIVCPRTHPYLFKGNRLLILASLVLFFCLLILVATVVHQLTDWRIRISLYLDQVKILLSCNVKRTHRCHDADHLSVFVNQAYLACTYSLVHSCLSLTVVTPKIPVNRPNLPLF